MSEQTQNWQPYPLPDPPQTNGTCSARVCSGVAAPDNADGNDGNVYIRDNGEFFRKESGIWQLKFTSAGGTPSTEIYYISTPGQNPNNVQTATRPAIAYDSAGATWIKTGSGTNSTGWEQRLE